MHIHSTRKFFRSNVGLHPDLTHALMGHYGYLDKSYLRTDLMRAVEEYKAHMDNVTIFSARATIPEEEISG